MLFNNLAASKVLKLAIIHIWVMTLLFGSFQAVQASASGTNVVDVDHDAMNFGTPTLITAPGTDKLKDAVYQYLNVITKNGIQVDAKVTIAEKSSANLGLFDDPSSNLSRFQPTVSTPSGAGYFNFKFDFIDHATGLPVLIHNFFMTVVDIDGVNSTVKEYAEVSGFKSYTVDTTSGLTIGPGANGRTKFTGLSSSLQDVSFDNTASFIANYTAPISTMNVVIGNTGTVSGNARQFSINFGAAGGVFSHAVTTQNASSPTISVAIDDGGDGNLTPGVDDMEHVKVSGQTTAGMGQTVTVTVTDAMERTSTFPAIVQEDGTYEVKVDVTSAATGTIKVTANVVNQYGNPATPATDTTNKVAINTAPTASNVHVTGTAKAGQIVTGAYSYSDAQEDAENTSASGSSYKWYSGSNSDGSDKTVIGGATGKTYTLTNAEVGNYVFFEVTPVAQTGTLTGTAVIGESIGPVLSNVPTLSVTIDDGGDGNLTPGVDDMEHVKISGQTTAGVERTVTVTVTDAEEHTSTYTAIVQEDGTYEVTVDLTSAATGALTVTANVTNQHGTPAIPATDTTNKEAVNTAPTATNVHVTGIAKAGQIVTGSYSYSDAQEDAENTTANGSSYKWYSGSNNDGSDKTVIAGATSSTYTLTNAEVGKYVFFEVTPVAQTGKLTGTAVVGEAIGPVIPESASSVSGTVYSSTGGTVAGLTVELKSSQGQVIATTVTNSNGQYAFNEQAPGEVVVAARIPSKVLTTAEVVLVNGTPVVQDLTLPDNAQLKLTADPSEIVGDGHSTSNLTAELTWIDGHATPVNGSSITFTTTAGTLSEAIQSTDGNGHAISILTSPVINSVVPKIETTKVGVRDFELGIFAEAAIKITFQPATIKGVITSGDSNAPVAGASVRMTLDLNDDHVIDENDFDVTVITDVNGAYSVPVPRGDKKYNIQITQSILVGGVQTPVTYNQSASVGTVTGTGNEVFDSEKTAAGIVLFKNPDGSTSLLSNEAIGSTKIYMKDADGNYVMDHGIPKAFELQNQGLFKANGLEIGDYTLEIKYVFDSGEEIIIGQSTVSVTVNGEMNISQELVDPYGTITDANTNAVIEGAKVNLYYSSTQRNLDNGVTPNTGVVLPRITGFEPNDNASPEQYSDEHGFYAYMVFPNTDYYLVVTKSGYQTYTSPTISVGTAIVKHDLAMRPVSVIVPPSTTVQTPIIALNLTVEKNLVEEGKSSSITLDYLNQSTFSIDSGLITMTVPAGAEVVDANGGKVNGNTITWTVKSLSGGQTGHFTILLKWPQIDKKQVAYEITSEFIANPGSVSTAKAKAAGTVQVFSKRYDHLIHQRYILGYPDAQFKPDNKLTRAELAAIIARLTENDKSNDPLIYSDVKPNYWAANYIRIVTKYGFFLGYSDGTFHPDAPVTRGELAAVLARFLKLDLSSAIESHFNDLKGNWAEPAVEALYRGKFLSGYPDGTFKPQERIIRSEAVTLINHMLYRGPLKGQAAMFPDVPTTHWAFGDVQEATVTHEASRNSDGSEAWIKTLTDDVK